MVDVVSFLEPVHVLLRGDGWEAATKTRGFVQMMILGATLVPPTVIAIGMGMTEWHETPLGAWLGARPKQDESAWMDRAADLDGDGLPDI